MAGRVLVNVRDSAAASGKALQFAIDQAAGRKLGLHIVFIIDEAVASSRKPELLKAARDRGTSVLTEAATTVQRSAPDVDVEATIKEGDPTHVLVDLSEDYDMVVVGSNWEGHDHGGRFAVASLRVAAASDSPVAVIPDIDVTERRGVVVGLDGSDNSAHALEFAASEAVRINEPLIAVHAWTLPVVPGTEFIDSASFYEDLSADSAETITQAVAPIRAMYPKLAITPVSFDGDPTLALSTEAEHGKVVVVGSHGRGTVARLMLGSVSHGLLAHLVAPTVIVR